MDLQWRPCTILGCENAETPYSKSTSISGRGNIIEGGTAVKPKSIHDDPSVHMSLYELGGQFRSGGVLVVASDVKQRSR